MLHGKHNFGSLHGLESLILSDAPLQPCKETYTKTTMALDCPRPCYVWLQIRLLFSRKGQMYTGFGLEVPEFCLWTKGWLPGDCMTAGNSTG